MNGVQTRFKCKLDVKRCKRFVFPPSSLLPRSNALKTKAIRYFQTDRTLTRIVSPPLYEDLKVWENIRLYAGIYGMSDKEIAEKTDKVLEQLGLLNEKNTLVRSLPLGWKQKLAFSVAIFHEPKIVFLDEPTGGVDPATRRQFWELIYQTAERGITVFVTTHYMDEAEYCNRISMMVDGKIEALDTPQRLKERFHAQDMDEVFRQLARKAVRS